MGISIIGIIAVQLVWMNNALQVKNELFERGVNEALTKTVTELEQIHDFNVVNNMMFNRPAVWVSNDSTKGRPHFYFNSHSVPPPPPVKIVREYKGGEDATIAITIKKDSAANGAIQYTYQTQHKQSGNGVVVLNGNNVKTNSEIVVVQDTLEGNVDSLFTIGIVSIDSLEDHLDSLKVVAPDFSNRVRLKATRLKSLANQVVTEVSTWDANTIDHVQIGETLKKNLDEQKIDIGFEYGVLRDSVIAEKSENADSLLLAGSKFRAGLYPHNIFRRGLVLSVYFPEKDGFIIRSINWLLLASFIFSMIILLTFAASIFYILKQKKISEMKSDFINNMTHEFKTPIATISVATDSIINDKVISNPDQVRFFTGMIKKENTRMNRQVEDILTIARLDKKEFEFRWEPVDVHELIEEAVQSILIQVDKRGGQIELNLKAANPVATTDRVHCTNLIYNLLDNANKYSADTPQISVSTKNHSKGIILSVEDKGIGMSKSVQSKIFERFYRQTSGNIHNVKGFGLGLSYVKAVVEANHGTISVHSEPGKGSRFEVFLPFLRTT